MCKNLNMGTVMGKTRACVISTVAWFFGERRVPQIAARVEQISEFITMWRGFDVGTRRRIRLVWGKKAPSLAKDHRRWNQTTGPISATVLEAGWKPSTPGFWQSPGGSATLDGALFNKAQVIESFSEDMEMQMWKKAAGHPLSTGMVCQEGQVSTDQRRKFHSRACAGFSCFWSQLATSVDLFPTNFSVFVATREPWPPGSTNYGNVQETV